MSKIEWEPNCTADNAQSEHAAGLPKDRAAAEHKQKMQAARQYAKKKADTTKDICLSLMFFYFYII